MQVYLDNSATTQPFPRVVAVMREAMETGWYNPSALYKPAMEAEKRVTAVRTDCLKAVNAQGHRMVFTSGGTEADNLAIIGHLLHGQATRPCADPVRGASRGIGLRRGDPPPGTSGGGNSGHAARHCGPGLGLRRTWMKAYA